MVLLKLSVNLLTFLEGIYHSGRGGGGFSQSMAHLESGMTPKSPYIRENIHFGSPVADLTVQNQSPHTNTIFGLLSPQHKL